MDPATIAATIKTAKKVYKYGKLVIEYIRDDQSAKLGLLRPVRMSLKGPGVGIGDFTAPDGLFQMRSPSPNRLEMDFAPFPADANSPWNGPDVIPNAGADGKQPDGLFEELIDGALPASLPHDFICKWKEQIAKALGMTVNEVWVWASGVMANVWKKYGGDDTKSNVGAWIGYQLTRIFGKPYMWIKRQLALILLLSALAILPGCAGCAVPDWHVVEGTPVVSSEGGQISTNAIEGAE